MDQPSENALPGVNDFLAQHPYLGLNGQFVRLPFRDIEQCYPDFSDASHGQWKKTQQEMDQVNPAGKKVFNSHRKIQLAKHVGSAITKQQFEHEMPDCLDALIKCWDLAFD